MWRRGRAALVLGTIDGRLRRPLAAGDTPALAAALRQLAGLAGQLRADDHGVWQVLGGAELAIAVVGQRGSPADLDAAIAACTDAAEAASDELLAPVFQGLRGTALYKRFERTGQLDDLDASISARQQAADDMPESHPGKAATLANLVPGLEMRFRLRGRASDLDAAIKISRDVAARIADDDWKRGSVLSNLTMALQDRYELTGNLDDLDEAIRIGQQAVESASDDAGRAPCLMNLGLALQRRFERSGVMADANDAVKANTRALQTTDPQDPKLAYYLTSLASALRLRGEQTGDIADLDAAVERDQQAVDTHRSVFDPARAMRISHLGVSLLGRYERTGGSADLDAAVEAGQRSVATAADDDPFRVLCLTNLSASLTRRYERMGEFADLNAAAEASQQAADLLAPGNPGRPRCLGNLANVLQARFGRRHADDDLNRAVEASREAVTAAPADDANRGSYLNSLANALQLRFLNTRDAADLDDSIATGRKAAKATSDRNQLLGMVLGGLALGLLYRFLRADGPADLDESIETGKRAIAVTETNDPKQAALLSRVVLALFYRFRLARAPADLAEGLNNGRRAAAIEAASPAIRVGAAIAWGNIAAEAEDWPEAVRAYQQAIGLVGELAPRSLARSDQEYQLFQVTGLGSRAAACCLQLGDTDLAAEILEHGRGVLLGQALDTRTDLTALSEQHRDIADRFIRCRDDLDRSFALGALGQAANGPERRPGAPDYSAEHRRRLRAEFDSVIAEARSLPGFERFLLPAEAGELRRAATAGPVALINVDAIRSDALLLTASGVRVVPLPALSAGEVRARATGFLEALSEYHAPGAGPVTASQTEDLLSSVLGWLWDTVAGPVLAELKLTSAGRGSALETDVVVPDGLDVAAPAPCRRAP